MLPRALGLLLPIPLAFSSAFAQNNLYSGNGWGRTLEASHLPDGTGSFDQIELGQLLKGEEPELLILRDSQLLVAIDAASVISYDTVASGVTDFAVLRSSGGDRVVIARAGGLELFTPEAEEIFSSSLLTADEFQSVREVPLGTENGVAAWENGDVRVYDGDLQLAFDVSVSGVVRDVITGDFLVGAGVDLAVLTADTLYVFRPGESGATLEVTSLTADGRLGFAPGSASGLDLLLWLDGPFLQNFNESWLAEPLIISGTQISAMFAVDYHEDPQGLADLVVIDELGRQAMVLVRNDPVTAIASGKEFDLPTDPQTTFFIPLDGEPAGAPLTAAMGDFDLDGDADLLALGGPNGTELEIRPGERVDAEALRVKLHRSFIREVLGGSGHFQLGFLALDSSTSGPAFPPTATHLELTVWEAPDAGPTTDPTPIFQSRVPIGSGDLPLNASSTIRFFDFPSVLFTFESRYYLRLRVIEEQAGASDVVFPSRVEVYSFENPLQWTPPSGWQLAPFIGRQKTEPDGTGGLRGGGGGPTPPGNNGG